MVTRWVVFAIRPSSKLFGCSLTCGCLVMGGFTLLKKTHTNIKGCPNLEDKLF
jgi:hypothetical protein